MIWCAALDSRIETRVALAMSLPYALSLLLLTLHFIEMSQVHYPSYK